VTLPLLWQYSFSNVNEKARWALDFKGIRINGPRRGQVGDGEPVPDQVFADLAAAALLFPLAWPPELQYEFPEPPPSGFLDSLAGHPAVSWIRETYRRHRGESAEVIGRQP
jgi:hypothetical protein